MLKNSKLQASRVQCLTLQKEDKRSTFEYQSTLWTVRKEWNSDPGQLPHWVKAKKWTDVYKTAIPLESPSLYRAENINEKECVWKDDSVVKSADCF